MKVQANTEKPGKSEERGIEQAARASLVADAGYCAGIGAGLAVMAGPVARTTDLPPGLVAGSGVAAVGWGGFVAILSRRCGWRGPLAGIAAANAAGAAALSLIARSRPSRAGRIFVGIVAAQVAVFAAVQGLLLALGRRNRQAGGRLVP